MGDYPLKAPLLPGSSGIKEFEPGAFPHDAFNFDDNTVRPRSVFARNGWMIGMRVKEVAADLTLTDDDGYSMLLVTTGAGNITITLPTAAANKWRALTVLKVDSGAGKVIVDGEGSETVGPTTTFELWFQTDCVELLCDGTGWLRIGGTGRRLIPWASRPASPVVDASTTRGSWTPVDFSAYAPPGVVALELAWILSFVGDDSLDYAQAILRMNGSTSTDPDQGARLTHFEVNCANGVTSSGYGAHWEQCDVGRVIQYYLYSSSGARGDGILSLNIRGYSYE